MRTIGITGGTGFIGHHLTELLVQKDYEVIIFTTRVAKKPTRQQVTYAHWDPIRGTFDINALKEVDAVVHLAGEGIADKRWTAERKKKIRDSRVNGTSFLITQLRKYAHNCKTLIAASAIGYYGPDTAGSAPFAETAPPATDFLGDTCRHWETESEKATDLLRTVILRFGIVLGKDSGAFREFSFPLSFGIMPILGPGTQAISWINIDDLVKLILFAIEHNDVSGTYNAVAPAPVTNEQLMRTIASVKGGFKIPIHVPAFFLKLLLGEMSTEVLKSCTVSAQEILGTGFSFATPDIDTAVKAILGKE
jgi:hypothetical protein